MTPGQNATLNYGLGWEFHIETWSQSQVTKVTLNYDSGPQFNVEFRPGIIIQRGIKTFGHISTWNLDPGHNSTLSWSRLKIPRSIMTHCKNSTLHCDPNSWLQFKVESWLGVTMQVELRPRVIIQRGIKTRGHNSTGSKFYLSEGSWYNDPIVQHENSVASEAQPVDLILHGPKIIGVKIQSYTGFPL